MVSDEVKTIQDKQDKKEPWLQRNPFLAGFGPLGIIFVMTIIMVSFTNEPWMVKNIFWIRPLYGLSGVAAALWLLVFGAMMTFMGVKKGKIRVRL